MASELRVNKINSRTGFGTITVSETGEDLVGVTTIQNLTTENTLVGAAASFTGNVQIGGVLTYEDVTNVDSVGIITAQKDIHVGAGVSAVGIITGQFLMASGGSDPNKQNVKIGWMQSENLTTGTYNVLLGRRAGEDVDTASSLVLIGANAGQKLTNQSASVIIGGGAGNNAIGDNNVYIGRNTAQQSTSAERNVIVGTYAGIDNQGNGNTLIGYYSGRGVSGATDGTQNTFIGHKVGFAIRGGDNNTGLGYDALLSLQNGTSNTALGDRAGEALLNGHSNVFIGKNTGKLVTNGSNDIVIGSGAQASTQTVSNEITLGNANITKFRIPGIGVSFNNTGGTQLGIITATELDISGDIDVDGHTNLDNASIAGVTTFSDTTESSSPTTGSVRLLGGLGVVKNIQTSGGLYATGTAGLNITHSADINGDLDVDGHTNLDNVSIAGVTTMSNTLTISNAAPNLLFTETDANPDWGILCSAGQMKFQDMTNTANILTLDSNKIQAVKNLDAMNGIDVTGNANVTGNIDVDGHTNLDNVSITGITTFTNGFVNLKPSGGGNAHFRILSTGTGDAGIFFDAANGDIAGSDYVFIGQQNNLDFVINANVNAGNIDFQRAGNTQLRITAAGDVGIGTAIPVVASGYGNLSLAGSTGGQLEFKRVSTDTRHYIWGNTDLNIGGGYYNGASSNIIFRVNGATERLRILSNGNISVGSNGAAAEKLQVNSGNIGIIGGSYKIDTHPLVSYANFTDISGGSYAARLGSTGTSTVRSTQIYGGGGHIATFDGVNKRLGINLTVPTAKLHVSAAYNETAAIISGGAINYNSCFIFKFANGDTVLEGDNGRHVVPGADAVQDLGLSTKRWRNVYTTDLQLSNENTGGNEIDGTEGNWTLQEGESDIYMINRKTGKKYKMMLQEVS